MKWHKLHESWWVSCVFLLRCSHNLLLPSVKTLLQRMKTSPRFPRKLPSTHSWSCRSRTREQWGKGLLICVLVTWRNVSCGYRDVWWENHWRKGQICHTCFKRASILFNYSQKIPRSVTTALALKAWWNPNCKCSQMSSVFKICKFMYWSMDFRVPLYSIPDHVQKRFQKSAATNNKNDSLTIDAVQQMHSWLYPFDLK